MTGTSTTDNGDEVLKPERSGGAPDGAAWVSEAERDLAQRGAVEFERGRWSGCLSLLRQLTAARPNDPKVAHNSAVTRFYQSGSVDVEDFRKSLARVAGQAQIALAESDNLDDADHCVVCYNQAVLLYHEQQYHSAIAILDKVFQFIEPVEEALARKACCLLLELFLRTFHMDKCLFLINYAENALLTTANSNNASGKCQSPDKEKSEKETPSGKDSVDASATAASSRDAFRTKLQQYKARLYLMSKSMRFCKRELKSLMSSIGASMFTIYVKSNLEYLRGNYRKALKVLNSAPHQVLVPGVRNVPTMYYNNVGCIHFYMGKPLLGCHYFKQALAEDKKMQALQPAEDGEDDQNGKGHAGTLTFSNRRHHELLFNLGLQLLHGHKPLAAFDCLVEAIQVYPTNLRLWLRLAECCIMAHKMDNVGQSRTQDSPKNVVQGVVGIGAHRKIVLSSNLTNKTTSSEVQSSAMPMPTLEFASHCLKNALLLLQEDTPEQGSLSGSFASDDGDGLLPGVAEVGTDQCINCLPSNPIRGQEIINLRIAVLVASSYVALCLGDVVMSLHYAETLLSHPKLPGVYKLLGHLYAGESLILLDRISDAIQHFSPDLMKDVPLTMNACEKDEKEKSTLEALQERVMEAWYPNSASVARTIMQYNLTVAFALRGEYEKANEALQQMGVVQAHSSSEAPLQAVMLFMYLQLQQGYVEATKNIIKQYIPQLK